MKRKLKDEQTISSIQKLMRELQKRGYIDDGGELPVMKNLIEEEFENWVVSILISSHSCFINRVAPLEIENKNLKRELRESISEKEELQRDMKLRTGMLNAISTIIETIN